MREIYSDVKLEIICFKPEDIVCTSGCVGVFPIVPDCEGVSN